MKILIFRFNCLQLKLFFFHRLKCLLCAEILFATFFQWSLGYFKRFSSKICSIGAKRIKIIKNKRIILLSYLLIMYCKMWIRNWDVFLYFHYLFSRVLCIINFYEQCLFCYFRFLHFWSMSFRISGRIHFFLVCFLFCKFMFIF